MENIIPKFINELEDVNFIGGDKILQNDMEYNSNKLYIVVMETDKLTEEFYEKYTTNKLFNINKFIGNHDKVQIFLILNEKGIRVLVHILLSLSTRFIRYIFINDIIRNYDVWNVKDGLITEHLTNEVYVEYSKDANHQLEISINNGKLKYTDYLTPNKYKGEMFPVVLSPFSDNMIKYDNLIIREPEYDDEVFNIIDIRGDTKVCLLFDLRKD